MTECTCGAMSFDGTCNCGGIYTPDCDKMSTMDAGGIPRWVPFTFENLAREIGRLTDEKQEAYGDSFNKAGQVMRVLYPDGIKPEQYDDALAVVRVIDKLFRIATKKDAFGESPWRDIGGYSLLGAARDEKENR